MLVDLSWPFTSASDLSSSFVLFSGREIKAILQALDLLCMTLVQQDARGLAFGALDLVSG